MERTYRLSPLLLGLPFAILLQLNAPAAHAQFSAPQVVDLPADYPVPRTLVAADLDRDGAVDLLTASFSRPAEGATPEGRLAWIRNQDGTSRFADPQTITDEIALSAAVHTADLNGDGDPDVLAALTDDRIAWLENTDGQGTFSASRIVTDSIPAVASLAAADLDGDGDLDVLAGLTTDPHRDDLQDQVVWFENTDGTGSFSEAQTVSTDAGGAATVATADLDGDGDADVLAGLAFGRQVVWYENVDGRAAFSEARRLDVPLASEGPTSVTAADLDGDGDLDVLAAASGAPEDPTPEDRVTWYENTGDAADRFSDPHVITTATRGARSVSAADLDGDGDPDALLGLWYDGQVVWFENTGGSPRFTTMHVVSDEADGAQAVAATDVDQDGDLDVLAAMCSRCGTFVVLPPEADRLAWYESDRVASGTEQPGERPQGVLLSTLYPNPFNPSATVAFDLPERAVVTVEIYDVLGRRVLALPSRAMPAGTAQRIDMNASHLPSGTYYYRISARTATAVLVDYGAMVLQK